MLDINIPFSGFYESIHSQEIDRAIESMFDDRETGEFAEWGSELSWELDHDYSATCEQYSKEYVESMGHIYDLELTFDGVDSPRYYNYSTDRVFAKISRDSVARMWRATDSDDLRDMIKKRFTSYDGFASHYSNDLSEWPCKLSEWDHNQLGALLLVYLETEKQGEWDYYSEWKIVEAGYIYESVYNLVYENSSNANRLTKIHEYLLERNKRTIKTMAQLSTYRRGLNLPFNATPLGGATL